MSALRTCTRSRVDVRIVPYREADAERVARLLVASQERRAPTSKTTLERWRAFASRPALADSVWLAECNGELHGLGWSLRERSNGRASRQFKILVAPEQRRRGIGSKLLGAIEAQAEPHSLLQSELQTRRRSAQAFLEAHGFRSRPSLERLLRSTASAGSSAVPPGYRERTLASDADRAAWCELHARAFAAALHCPPLDAADATALANEPGFHLSLVETESGELAGYAQISACRQYGDLGVLTEIAVDASHRGRGLGEFLVRKALRFLHERGLERCELYVERDAFVPGHLYRSIGFRPTFRQDCWRRSRMAGQRDPST